MRNEKQPAPVAKEKMGCQKYIGDVKKVEVGSSAYNYDDERRVLLILLIKGIFTRQELSSIFSAHILNILTSNSVESLCYTLSSSEKPRLMAFEKQRIFFL